MPNLIGAIELPISDYLELGHQIENGIACSGSEGTLRQIQFETEFKTAGLCVKTQLTTVSESLAFKLSVSRVKENLVIAEKTVNVNSIENSFFIDADNYRLKLYIKPVPNTVITKTGLSQYLANPSQCPFCLENNSLSFKLLTRELKHELPVEVTCANCLNSWSVVYKPSETSLTKNLKT